VVLCTFHRLSETEGALRETEGGIARLQQELAQVVQTQQQWQTRNEEAQREVRQLQEQLTHVEGDVLPAKNAHILMSEKRLHAMDASFAVKAV